MTKEATFTMEEVGNLLAIAATVEPLQFYGSSPAVLAVIYKAKSVVKIDGTNVSLPAIKVIN